MALNWSRDRARKLVTDTRRAEIDAAAYTAELEGYATIATMTKAEQRASTAALVAGYRGTVLVTLKCYNCNHRGRARINPGQRNARFRCSKCGAASL